MGKVYASVAIRIHVWFSRLRDSLAICSELNLDAKSFEIVTGYFGRPFDISAVAFLQSCSLQWTHLHMQGCLHIFAVSHVLVGSILP